MTEPCKRLSNWHYSPEWEARFESNSYGFRPGRSCHDAIEQIFTVISQKAKYVLDADIAKCFDHIDHEALLNKLNTFPTIRRQVRAWLKSGVMENKQLFPTSEGTPQGGVISPLLANIALHGMENRITQAFPTRKVYKKGKYAGLFTAPNFVRYADDFVILHEDITVVQRCREIISEWLKGMGLELKPSKTRLAHTLEEFEGETPGFNFLGFNIRQYRVGKYHSGKNNGKLLGFKTLVTPSKDKQRIHYEQVASTIDAHKTATQKALIGKLNPIIRGWANYYSTKVSKEAYSYQDYLMYQKLIAWAKYRHPKKAVYWIVNKYWKTIGGSNWVFAANAEGENLMRLRTHSETPIVRHVKVKGESSPYDGNLAYWSIRMGKHPEISTREAILLKRQKGKCNHCGLTFRDGDKWEIDHNIPRSKGGKDEYNNLQLLHKHCHDSKTTEDGSVGGSIDSCPSH